MGSNSFQDADMVHVLSRQLFLREHDNEQLSGNGTECIAFVYVRSFRSLSQYLFCEKWDKHHAAFGTSPLKNDDLLGFLGLRILLVNIVAHHEL